MGVAVFVLVVLVSTAWVAVDARGRDFSGNTFGSTPAQWAIGTCLLWIIVFPVYLYFRNDGPSNDHGSPRYPARYPEDQSGRRR